jgi:hypothetical protein
MNSPSNDVRWRDNWLLAAPIIAHGVTDTVDVLLMYVGKYAGMR